MSVPEALSNQLLKFIQRVEQYLDNVVEHGDDQQLFIASYLQGHFAVQAGQSQVQNMSKISELDCLMNESLNAAFDNKELTPEDQEQVWVLWRSFS